MFMALFMSIALNKVSYDFNSELNLYILRRSGYFMGIYGKGDYLSVAESLYPP